MKNKKFVNYVSRAFLTKEQKLKLKLQDAERLRQEIVAGKHLSNTHASRKDRVAETEAISARHVQELGEYKYSQQQAAADLVNGVLPSQIALRLAAWEALQRNLEGVKAEVRLLLVQPAIASLEQFEKENAEKLERLPKLKEVEEPDFAPPAPVDEWSHVESTPLEKAAKAACDCMATDD